MSYGFASHFGIAKEVTWGTPVAASDYIEILSESMATAFARFETRNAIGGFFEPDDSKGIETHQGDLVFAAHPVSIGYLLDGLFGINSATLVLSGFLYTTEFTVLQTDLSSLAPLPGYTFEVFRAGTLVNTAFQYAGVQFGATQFNIVPNQDLRVTANCIGRTRAMIAKTTPSFPGSPIQPFTFDTTSLSLGGAAIDRIEALTITFDPQLEGVPALNNSLEIAKVRRTGPPMVSLSGTVDFVDLADFDAFVAETEQQVVLSVTKADSFSLVIDIPRTIFTAFPVQIPGRERLTVDFEMKGRYHAGSASAIKATLTTVQTF